MATTIKLKNSVTTTNAPSSLVQGEVAINITDKKVWVGNAATTPIQLLGAGASGTFGALTCTSLTNSGLTSGRVTYATTAGLLTDSANLTFNGTTLTANTIGAFTLGGTISGGGNQINNVIIGNSNPLAGSFTTLSASGVATISAGTVSAPALTTTGDTNTGIFFPAADTIAFTEGGVEAMRINSSGNVLIGATTLEGSVTTGAVKYLVLSGGYASNPQQIGMTMLGGADGAVGHFTFSGQSSGGNPRLVASISGYQTGTTVSAAAGYLAFNTNVGTAEQPTERMRIDSSGNVGIGTSSPLAGVRLDTFGGYFRLRSNTTINADISGNVNALVFESSGGTGEHAIIAGGNTSNNFLSFYTANAAAPAERMRITSGGALCVGTTATTGVGETAVISGDNNVFVVRCNNSQNAIITSNSSGTATYKAGVFCNDGSTYTERGNISVGASSVTYNTTSDYRLKNNVTPMVGALNKVAQLKPCTYTWKETGNAGQGFIAHELAEVCPDAVTGEKDAVDEQGNPRYQGVDTSFLVATLTAAIQELKAELDSVKAELNQLKGA